MFLYIEHDFIIFIPTFIILLWSFFLFRSETHLFDLKSPLFGQTIKKSLFGQPSQVQKPTTEEIENNTNETVRLDNIEVLAPPFRLVKLDNNGNSIQLLDYDDGKFKLDLITSAIKRKERFSNVNLCVCVYALISWLLWLLLHFVFFLFRFISYP